MSFRSFQSIFHQILDEIPLPNGDIWTIQTLQKAGLRNSQGWMEVLYRTYAYYRCNKRHYWESSWGMILFRFYLDASIGFGRVRMKRFGQRCSKCPKDDTYYVGLCDVEEAWYIVQRLLLTILWRCYEKRPDCDVDEMEYIIPVSNVASGKFRGPPHRKENCEACAHDRCQEKFRELEKRR